jgi:hypothetical protein
VVAKKSDTNDEGLMVMRTLFEAYIIVVYILAPNLISFMIVVYSR